MDTVRGHGFCWSMRLTSQQPLKDAYVAERQKVHCLTALFSEVRMYNICTTHESVLPSSCLPVPPTEFRPTTYATNCKRSPTM